MVGALGAHEHGADVKIEVFEFFDFDVAGQFIEGNGEISAFHLAGEGGDESFARAFATEDAQTALGVVNRTKERQSLNMIPMGMREEQGQVERFVFEFLEQGLAEGAQAGAGIEDDDFIAVAVFHAGGIAAVTHGGFTGRGDGAAHTPELDGGSRFDGVTLIRAGGKLKSEKMKSSLSGSKKSCKAARVH